MTGNHITEGEPVAQNHPFGFGPHYQLPAFWPGYQESICVQSGPNPNSIIKEANVQNPSLQRTRHLDFLPKLGSNSVFKSQPTETGGAWQRTYMAS